MIIAVTPLSVATSSYLQMAVVLKHVEQGCMLEQCGTAAQGLTQAAMYVTIAAGTAENALHMYRTFKKSFSITRPPFPACSFCNCRACCIDAIVFVLTAVHVLAYVGKNMSRFA